MPACLHACYHRRMAQVTWRASEQLVERVQRLAQADGVSMNEFLTRVMTLVSDVDETQSAATQLRARLRACGLLAEPSAAAPARPAEDSLRTARAAAAQGTPLSEVVDTLRS